MNRVLVTGAAGYIGSHACKALWQAGFEPIGLDNMERAGVRKLPWGVLETADVRDSAAVTQILERYTPIAAMHFAAYAYVGESVSQPALYYENNTMGSLSLCSALRGAGIDKIVFSSTCATYGIPERSPITEDQPQRPINPYGASKLMVEQILRDFDQAYGFRHVALRYFNAAGADSDGEVGENHEPETHAVPLAIQTALGERAAFDIFGTDYPTPDGTAIRDYIYIEDLARAHVLALKYLLTGGASTALNLGTGKGHSVKELIAAVESVTAKRVKTRLAPRRAGDPPILVADAQRAQTVLGWRAEVTDLATIVRSALLWHEKTKVHAG